MNDKHSEAKSTSNTPTESAGQCAALNQAALLDLLRRLENVQENAYSCEETFDLLDEYVELVVTDEEAAALMPLVKNHLDMCPDCRERYEILLRILEAEPFALAE
ncbi:MAG TPA: zf-HC2 domain-containing protein [Anaerolineae bacterium]|nr:zf-HC2 domain-containing protein [Anaerolineae bacterium]HIP70041.1 zf-HC2 domain-containing protein [Anaerolineae bacterium]